MSDILGNNHGVEVWQKLAESKDSVVVQYFQRLNRAASQYGEVYFQDVERQYAGETGLPIYRLGWSGERWECSLFMTPQPLNNNGLNNEELINSEVKRISSDRAQAERILASRDDVEEIEDYEEL